MTRKARNVQPHIGMKIWRFNENRRVYKEDAHGRRTIGPIWREHWEPTEIIGETSRSWLVGSEFMKTWPDFARKAAKIAKADFPGNDYAVSEDDIDRRAFVHNRHKLVDRIQNCRDYDTLKAIETALDALAK